MGEFYTRNKELANGDWINGWTKFCEEMKPVYLECVAKAFAPGSTPKEDGKFSHYLDCEAHTDVWREIFPSLNLTNCIDEE